MISTIQRGSITSHLIGVLETANLPVGDNTVPTDAYGWQGEPNADGSTFIPWMSLNAGVAQPGNGPFAASAADWKLPYTVNYAAVSRAQLDWLADKMRDVLVNTERTTVTTLQGTWKFVQVRCTAVGATNRVGNPFPDYFTEADLFEVWISKEL